MTQQHSMKHNGTMIFMTSNCSQSLWCLRTGNLYLQVPLTKSSYILITSTYNIGNYHREYPNELQVLKLLGYDFKIHHIPGKLNGRASSSALSRRPNYDQGENDNTNVTILLDHIFV